MTEERTAAQVGQYDQALAAAEAEIDRLVGIVQVLAAEAGERQAVADVCALISDTGTAELAGLLAAALLRLARRAGETGQ
jgi:hypothetical protein